MKAQPSPLKCLSYFITELVLTANPKHNPENPIKLDFADLTITATTERLEAKSPKSRNWRVALRILQNISDEKKNCPYNFAVSLLGTFAVHPEYPESKLEQLVKINGSSILYSSARQMLWDIMGNGPFRPLIFPTVSFVDEPEEKRNTLSKKSKPKRGAITK